MTTSSRPLRIGYLPFYVDYYEGVCADFPAEKKTQSLRGAEILATHGEVIWDGAVIGDSSQAEDAGRRLQASKVDCVVVFTSIAVFSAIPWAALRLIEQPILLWNAQARSATILSFAPSRRAHRYRVIVAEGEILAEAVPGAEAIAAFFRFTDSDQQKAYARWMEAGAVHHAATTQGHWSANLKAIASLMNFEFVAV